MKSIHFFIIMMIVGLSSSCKQADEFTNKVYFTDAQSSDTKLYSVYEMPQKFPIVISSSAVVSRKAQAFMKVAEEVVDGYNKRNSTAYKLLPASYYVLSSDTLTIPEGSATSKAVYLTILELPPGDNYLLPLKIDRLDSEFELLEASSTLFMAFKPGIITPAANIKSKFLRISKFASEENLKSVNQVSYEARIKVHAWSTASHKIASLMGIEENFLLRFGDVNIEANQLQLAGGGYPVTSNTRFGLETWYHVAVVYDGASIKLYVNGKEDNSVSAPRGPINLADTYSNGFHIGYSAGGRNIDATVSECRVWTKALTATEINSNMCYVDPETPGLLAYWKFNEGEGREIKDYSPNNYTVNMVSGPTWETGVRCPEE